MAVSHLLLVDLTESLDPEILQDGDELRGDSSDRDQGHQRQIFDQAIACSLRGFCGIDHPPVGFVDLPGLGKFPSLGDR